MFLLEKLTLLLPLKLQPYAKACYPAIFTIAGTLYTAAQTGVLDTATILVAAGGAAYTLITLGVPNLRAPVTITLPAFTKADLAKIGEAAVTGIGIAATAAATEDDDEGPPLAIG